VGLDVVEKKKFPSEGNGLRFLRYQACSLFMVLQPFDGPWPLFQFLDLFT
jgi:hypothetical protein